jgi:ribosome-binding factor A
MAGARMRRVNEAVREVVSTHIAEDLKDPRIGFVTVTGVETSADLRSARVFVSVLGDSAELDDAMAGLVSARGFLQAKVGAELRMKRTPTLDFVHDDSINTGLRISKLISDVVPEDGS